MRRITLTSAALALCLLLGGVAIAGATPAAKPEPKGRTLEFQVRFSPFQLIDVDHDGGPTLGDYVVFHDLLFQRGRQVGDEGGTCPLVDVAQGLIHCTGTIRLAGGQPDGSCWALLVVSDHR